MDKMFEAVKEHYQMKSEYKNTRNTLLELGLFCNTVIWKNFTYFIDWMEITSRLSKEEVLEIMGKSYHLEDNILYRISKPEDDIEQSIDPNDKRKTLETWLMSNIFRYLENPNKDKFCNEEKYIGKIKFTKCIEGEYDGEYIDWRPGSQVDDIRIEVFIDDEMQDPRHYEVEHGWKTKWETEKFPLPNWDKIEFEDELEMDWYYVYELDEAKHRQSWHN